MQAASKDEKLNAMNATESYIKSADATTIVRVLEGLETAIFKQYFTAWNEIDKESETLSNIAGWKVEDLHTENRKRVERAAGSAPGSVQTSYLRFLTP